MKQIARKEEYLAKLMHDLKTPATAQACALESLLKTTTSNFSEEESDLIKLTLNSCNNMKKLIDTFLFVFKLKNQKLVLKYEQFDLVQLVNEVISELKILLKYNELKIKIISNTECIINADKSNIKRVIENILQRQKAEYALSDKFGDEMLIKNALMNEGRQIRLEQRTKAESDIAVACASVLARYEFVRKIDELSLKYSVNLPKGASDKVLEAGRQFCKKYGEKELSQVAKLHFKTTKEILNQNK